MSYGDREKSPQKKKIGTGLRTFLEWDLISFCGVLSKLTYNSLQPQITLVYQTISLLCKLKVHVLAHTALTTLDSIHVFAHTHTHIHAHSHPCVEREDGRTLSEDKSRYRLCWEIYHAISGIIAVAIGIGQVRGCLQYATYLTGGWATQCPLECSDFTD